MKEWDGRSCNPNLTHIVLSNHFFPLKHEKHLSLFLFFKLNNNMPGSVLGYNLEITRNLYMYWWYQNKKCYNKNVCRNDTDKS